MKSLNPSPSSLLSSQLFHRLAGRVGSKGPARGPNRLLVSAASLAIYAIACPLLQAQPYAIGGSVAGLTAGSTIVLQNNGGPPLTVTSDGLFLFPAELVGGATYNVTIKQLPSGETCSLANASGTVNKSDITQVWVSCEPTGFVPPPSNWTPLTNKAPGGVGTMLLLSDGSVMSVAPDGVNWFRLSPDSTGHYVNGTWTSTSQYPAIPPMNCPHGLFASQVLTDGRVFIAGGEYPEYKSTSPPGPAGCAQPGDANSGVDSELYDPVANTWETFLTISGNKVNPVDPPTNLINPLLAPNNPAIWGRQSFGDMISSLLPDGRVLMAPLDPMNCGDTLIFDPTLYNSSSPGSGWSFAGTLANDYPAGAPWTCDQEETTWVKLSDGSVLTADPPPANGENETSEHYIPSENEWATLAPVGFDLFDSFFGWDGHGEEGPAFLLPNGSAFFVGGSPIAGIYTPGGTQGTWTQTSITPDGPATGGAPLAADDAAGAMMVDGNILLALNYQAANHNPLPSPYFYYEYDYSQGTFTEVLAPGNPGAPSVWADCAPNVNTMLDLPDGTVLMASGCDGTQLYVYQPGLPLLQGRPHPSSISKNADGSYLLGGTGFNGISEGASYGDDAQMATNYPLVRLTDSLGTVTYTRTYDWSTAGVMTGTAPVSTDFALPASILSATPQQYTLELAANGNPSWPLCFSTLPTGPLCADRPVLSLPGPLSLTECEGGTATTTLNVCNTGDQTLEIDGIPSSNPQFAVTTPSSGYPLAVSPDSCFPFQLQYTPNTTGTSAATLTFLSNDLNDPSTLVVNGNSPAPSINATISNAGNFGNVCPGGASSLNLNVTNQSSCNLQINSITTSAGFLPPTVKLPLTLTADATVPLPLSFDPSTSQACSATPITGTVTVNSNDPTQPGGNTTFSLSGTVPCPKIAATIPDSGNFGTSCSGQVSNLNLEVLNTGQCNLNIASISSSSAQFALPTSPLVLSADANVDLPVAFQPAKYGSPGYVTCSNTVPETSNITITSNDPTNPVYVVPVQGIEGCPTLVLGPLNLTGVNDYPPTVSDPTGALGCYTDKQITVSNTGICPLYVVNAATVNGLDGKGLPLPAAPLEYNVVNTTLPITVNPAAKPVPITVRFKPEILTDQNPFAPDQQTGALNLTSNDPLVGDNTAALCGEPTYGSGARILLVDTLNNPISEVTELILTTTNITPVFNETLKPAPLQPPANVCGNTINYHLDNETLKPTGSNPNAYYRVLVKDNPHYYPPVDFRLTQCQFQQIVIVRKY